MSKDLNAAVAAAISAREAVAPSGTAGALARGQACSAALATSTRSTGEGAGVDAAGAGRAGDRDWSEVISPQPIRAAPATAAAALHVVVPLLCAVRRRRGASSAISTSSAPRTRAAMLILGSVVRVASAVDVR